MRRSLYNDPGNLLLRRSRRSDHCCSLQYFILIPYLLYLFGVWLLPPGRSIEKRLTGVRGYLPFIRPERTFVPPVTAERSPPASRITGADSPVMVDSSTLLR